MYVVSLALFVKTIYTIHQNKICIFVSKSVLEDNVKRQKCAFKKQKNSTMHMPQILVLNKYQNTRASFQISLCIWLEPQYVQRLPPTVVKVLQETNQSVLKIPNLNARTLNHKSHLVFPFDADIILIFHCKQAIATHCNSFRARTLI